MKNKTRSGASITKKQFGIKSITTWERIKIAWTFKIVAILTLILFLIFLLGRLSVFYGGGYVEWKEPKKVIFCSYSVGKICMNIIKD